MADSYTIGNLVGQFVLGMLGAGVRVAIGHDKGEKQGKAKIFATMVAGTVLGGTSNSAMTSYLNLPDTFAWPMSFMVGLLGIGFIYQVLDGKLHNPFVKNGGKE